jgi:hypothetical protein
MVSAMEVVRLLLWNIGNDIDVTEFHIAKQMRTYTEL